MKEHEHAAKNKPKSKPTQDEVTKKDAIQQKEEHPQGHDMPDSAMAEGKSVWSLVSRFR